MNYINSVPIFSKIISSERPTFSNFPHINHITPLDLCNRRLTGTLLDDTSETLMERNNMMVEEMMLLANMEVGAHIHAKFPSCAVLRRHEPPTPEMFEPLVQARCCCCPSCCGAPLDGAVCCALLLLPRLLRRAFHFCCASAIWLLRIDMRLCRTANRRGSRGAKAARLASPLGIAA